MISIIKAFLFIAAILFVSPCFAAPALVAGHFCTNGNATTGSSVACTVNSTTAGNFIAVAATWCADASCAGTAPQAVSSVTDTNSNACVVATGASKNNSQIGIAIWFCANISTAINVNDTLTITLVAGGTPNYLTIYAAEFSGVVTSGANELVGNASSGAPTSSVATNGSTTVGGDLIFAISSNNTVTAVPVAPCVTLQNNGTTNTCWYVAGAKGTITVSWTSTSGNNSNAIAAFTPVASACGRALLGVGC